MATKRYFTDEEKSELLSNPYTARITDCKVYYTLAFKKFVIQEIAKPGMTAAKVFAKAGYRSGLFPPNVMCYAIRKIQSEASSEAGLLETKATSKSPAKKRHSETEFRELEQRVKVLEQQIEFFKKKPTYQENGTNHTTTQFRLIQQTSNEPSNLLTIKQMCALSGVSRSGYYSWCKNGSRSNDRETQDADFQLIMEAYLYKGYDKGIMGIYMRLLHMGIRMNHKKIRRLMK